MVEEYTSRHLAAQIIARWLVSGEYPNRMLSAVDQNRAAITELVYGVVRWKRLLEWIIRQTVRRVPPPRLKAFFLTALYEIFVQHNPAEYAVVNETVAAVKKEASPQQADFVNAVLRQALRDREKITAAIEKQSAEIRLSHPDILVSRWQKNYGETKTSALCEWNNSRPNIIIRLNTLMPESRLKVFPYGRANPAERGASPQVYHASSMGEPLSIGRLGSLPEPTARIGQGDASPYLFEIMPKHKHFFKVPHGLKVEDLPGYREGLFLVIDPFAVNAVELLDPRPGEKILDACAAPGGKTFLIAEKMRAKGLLVAIDRDEQRLLTLKANLRRLGIEGFVEVKKQDILEIAGTSEKYDRILADVPCSNTGVIRRKPDVRWNFSLKSLARLAAAQSKMLAKLAALLKPGGRLVYSTCSLEPEENEKLVTAWIKQNPSFRLVEEKHFFPPESGTDGGYAAAVRRQL